MNSKEFEDMDLPKFLVHDDFPATTPAPVYFR